MTVEEIKAEAAKLPASEGFALAAGIESSDAIRKWRRDEMIRELPHGVEQTNRGELIESGQVFAHLRRTLQREAF